MHLLCTVVMPAYNEAGCIGSLLTHWITALKAVFGDAFRVIVIDDGSRDGTADILAGLEKEHPCLMIHRQTNQGHGASVVNGYRMALAMDTGYVFQTDSDDQFETGDFLKLWECRHQSKFILGWRRQRHDPLHRRIITGVAETLTWLIFGVHVRDGNVPYRLMESGFLREILPLIPSAAFAPNLCLSIVAAKKGQDLLHIPVRHKARRTGKVSIMRWTLVKACLTSLRQLLALRLSPAMRR